MKLQNNSCPAIRRIAKFLCASAALIITTTTFTQAQTIIPLVNSDFDGGGGEIASQLTLLGPSSTIGPQQIGTSGWYGIARHANAALNAAGFRPGIEVDNDASSSNVGEIRYNLGASLGGLLGLEMPEADLWQPVIGQSLAANQTYTFSIDVDAGSLLDVSALTSRGFGIGLTVGATATSMGTMVADSLSNPGLVSLSLISGTAQRLTLNYTTNGAPPVGDLGVAIFAGRGSQTIQLSLLTDFDVDNASLTVVPEPTTIALLGLGLLVVIRIQRFRRATTRV